MTKLGKPPIATQATKATTNTGIDAGNLKPQRQNRTERAEQRRQRKDATNCNINGNQDNNLQARTKNVDQNDGPSEEKWQTVTYKRQKRPIQRRRKPIFTGTGTADADLEVVERIRYLYAWSFNKSVTQEKIMLFLKRKQRNPYYTVEPRMNASSATQSGFIIGVPESLYDVFTESSTWPPGVRYREWFPARPRTSTHGSGSDDNNIVFHDCSATNK
ncbi:hypothetical protein O0L34_g13532 [Tuta absoluta]|nr:hypothetical protein O0L34_g13532 [Tuta absoluta]